MDCVTATGVPGASSSSFIAPCDLTQSVPPSFTKKRRKVEGRRKEGLCHSRFPKLHNVQFPPSSLLPPFFRPLPTPPSQDLSVKKSHKRLSTASELDVYTRKSRAYCSWGGEIDTGGICTFSVTLMRYLKAAPRPKLL